MAPRLRQEPYNSNAVDADNDGIVQEGTAFERPAGTQIVDEFNRIIENGRSSLSRASGWRVVDQDGNNVDYTPTYGTAGAAPEAPPSRSALGQTLGESQGTLAATLGGTLGERSGTLADGKPDAPLIPADGGPLPTSLTPTSLPTSAYNPDAKPDDNGIIQAGTAWERPEGTIVIDALGFPVDYGKMSSSRLPGQKIVDLDGNPVDFTPSYMKDPAAAPDGPPTHGISTLADLYEGLPIGKPPKQSKKPKGQSSFFGLPKKWKEPKKAKFQIPKQEYDTPLLGEPMVTDGIADTSKALFDKKEGRYFKERRKLHKAIVAWHRDRSKPKPDGEPRTIFFLGGGPGSGKTSMFKSGTFGIDPEVVRVDPDEIKTMIPEYRQWLDENYVESAGMVHGESKHITELATAALIDDGADMVYDTTGDGNYNGMRKRLEEMRRNGHKIVARYSTISKAKAHQINEERFKQTGRKVPGHQVDHVHTQVSVNVMNAIADGLFDDLELYDNEDFPNEPSLILTVKDGELTILDKDKVQAFIDKAGPSLQPGRKSPNPINMSQDEARKASKDSFNQAPDSPERDSWVSYMASGYRDINATLRDPNSIDSNSWYNVVVDRINGIDEVFEQHSASTLTPSKVHRGTVDLIRADEVPEEYMDMFIDLIEQQTDGPIIKNREAMEIIAEALNSQLDPKKRTVYRDPAFMSTAQKETDAISFANGATLSNDVLEAVKEDAETIGFPMVMDIDVPAGTRFMAGADMESELVFDRGTGVEIIRYEVMEGPPGKFHVRAITEMKPAKGKPPKLEKVEEENNPFSGTDQAFFQPSYGTQEIIDDGGPSLG